MPSKEPTNLSRGKAVHKKIQVEWKTEAEENKKKYLNQLFKILRDKLMTAKIRD